MLGTSSAFGSVIRSVRIAIPTYKRTTNGSGSEGVNCEVPLLGTNRHRRWRPRVAFAPKAAIQR